MDTRRILLFFIIFISAFHDSWEDQSIHNADKSSFGVDEDGLPALDYQRDIITRYLCNNDTNLKCELTELIIQKLIENEYNKVQLVRKILNRTDLYGAADNETVHPYFIDNVINNLVFWEVFGQRDNLLLFIIDLVNKSVTRVQEFKDKIRHKLTTFKTRENIPLSNNVVKWVMDNLIEPLLPNTNDVDIFSFDYAYAQAGAVFARSFKLNLTDISFEEFIQLSGMIETLYQAGHVDETHMHIFLLPAFLHYCRKHIDSVEAIKGDISNGKFNWTLVFGEFFSEINEIYQSPVVKFFIAMSGYRNRTQLAADIIEQNCTRNDLKGDVTAYINDKEDYQCLPKNPSAFWPSIGEAFIMWFSAGQALKANANINDYRRPKLTDVTLLFNEQNRYIADQYKEYERHIIMEGFKLDNLTRQDIENRIIHKAQMWEANAVAHVHSGGVTGPQHVKEIMSDTVDLFGFRESNSPSDGLCTKFYAILRKESRVTFQAFDNKKPNDFYDNVLVPNLININKNNIRIGCITKSVLKQFNQNYTQLATSIATYRAKELQEYLEKSGMNETGLEKFKKFFMSLIPFYTAIQNLIEGKSAEATIALLFDLLSLVPLIGQSLKIGFELFKAFALGALRGMVMKQTMMSAIRFGLSALVTASKGLLFSRSAFISIGKTVLRALDPGFESLYHMGSLAVGLFRALKNKFPIFSKIAQTLINVARIPQSLKMTIAFLPGLQGVRYVSLVGTYAKRNVYVQVPSILHASNKVLGSGYKYLELINHKYGELRTLVTRPYQVPVQLADINTRNRRIYEELDIVTGEPNGLHLSESRDGRLKYELIESKCVNPTLRLTRRNVEIVNFFQDPVEKISKALACSTKQAQTLLSHYFLENYDKYKWFAAEVKAHGYVPEYMEAFKLRFPELIHGIEVSTLLNTPQLVAEARQSIRDIYSPSDLIRINIDIDAPRPGVIRNYNYYQRNGNAMSFEDYFAIRNFGHTGRNRIDDDTMEAIQMRNAFARLTIRQSFRLKLGKKFLGFRGMVLSKEEGESLVYQGATISFPGNYLKVTMRPKNILKKFDPYDGLKHYLFRLEVDCDCVVADISDIYRDLFVLHNSDLSFNVISIVQDSYFDEYGDVLLTTIRLDNVERSKYVTRLMNSLQ